MRPAASAGGVRRGRRLAGSPEGLSTTRPFGAEGVPRGRARVNPRRSDEQVRALTLQVAAGLLVDRLRDGNQGQRGLECCSRLDAATGDGDGHVLLALEVAVGHL